MGYDASEIVKIPEQARRGMIDDTLEGPKGAIGNVPYAHRLGDAIEYMTPDEYFDIVGSPGHHVGRKGGPWRWPMRDNSHANVKRMIRGMKEGKVLGMPSLAFRADKYTGPITSDNPLSGRKWNDVRFYDDWQEGGHRMEALRQMGHADTPVPVFQHRRIRGE